MKFTAEIDIMPRKELLDPQGKAVLNGMGKLPIEGIADVRIGKHISMILEAATKDEATAKTDEACRMLLANLVVETYHFTLIENGELQIEN